MSRPAVPAVDAGGAAVDVLVVDVLVDVVVEEPEVVVGSAPSSSVHALATTARTAQSRAKRERVWRIGGA